MTIKGVKMDRAECYTTKELFDWIYLQLELIKKDVEIIQERTIKKEEQ